LKTSQKSLLVVLFSHIFLLAAFAVPFVSFATEEPTNYLQYLEELQSFGMDEGTGNHFEISDSDYLNIILDSTQEVSARIESIPNTITITIEPSAGPVSTQLTLGGFLLNTTYYKYEDDYHNLTTFLTDNTGTYSYVQDISEGPMRLAPTWNGSGFWRLREPSCSRFWRVPNLSRR